MSMQNLDNIEIYTSIQSLYPDINGQLENRHCSMYGKIKAKFQKIYSDFVPQVFVNVKGVMSLLKVHSTPCQLTFALQNGIIMAVGRTYKNENIYINSNYNEQEIQLECTGNIVENESDSIVANWAKIGFQAALSDCLPDNLYGAIIYLESNIPKDSFNYKECHIMAFALAAVFVNSLQQQFSLSELQLKISEVVQNGQFPTFDEYNNGEMRLSDGEFQIQIPAKDSNWKMIIADLQLEPLDLAMLLLHQNIISVEQKLLETLINNELGRMVSTVMDMKRQFVFDHIEELKSLSEQTIKRQTYSVEQASLILGMPLDFPANTTFNPKQRALNIIQQYNNLATVTNDLNRDTLQTALNISYMLNLKQNLVANKAIQLVDLCLGNNALACTVVGQYLVILIQKTKMLKLFQLIKRKIFVFNTESSESLYSKGVHHMIFSTLPSRATGILQPDSDQLWFQ